MKNKIITFRATEEQKKKIERQAKKESLTRTGYIYKMLKLDASKATS